MSDRVLVSAVCAFVVGVWQYGVGSVRMGAAVLVVMLGGRVVAGRERVPITGCLLACIVMFGCWWGGRAWAHTAPRELGTFTGWARLAADPASARNGVRLTLEIEGERFDTWLYGSRARSMADEQAGDWWWVAGERVATAPDRRAAVRHVVGRFRLDRAGDVVTGAPWSRAANRVRSTVRHAADSTMEPLDAALFTGLVLGDDARQPWWLVDEFRRSGLSHLTAVSGQNVGFVLAAALPLLRRLRPWWRWAVTVGLVVWFMALTRFEASVMRAGVMACLAATVFVRGAVVSPRRLVALTVLIIVMLDPLLVWSIGFWLSVGATLGLVIATTPLRQRLPGPDWLRLPLAVTVAAQAGVAVPSLLVFGRLPLLSLPANLAAVPVAGFVMLWGLPAALASAVLPTPVGTVVLFPAEIGTRWVSTVARVAAVLEPAAPIGVLGWAVLGVGWLAWRVQRRRVPF